MQAITIHKYNMHSTTLSGQVDRWRESSYNALVYLKFNLIQKDYAEFQNLRKDSLEWLA